MVIETVYNFGDIVFHKLGEQPEGQITGIRVQPAGKAVSIIYQVTFADRVSDHYEFELLAERTFINESK